MTGDATVDRVVRDLYARLNRKWRSGYLDGKPSPGHAYLQGQSETPPRLTGNRDTDRTLRRAYDALARLTPCPERLDPRMVFPEKNPQRSHFSPARTQGNLSQALAAFWQGVNAFAPCKETFPVESATGIPAPNTLFVMIGSSGGFTIYAYNLNDFSATPVTVDSGDTVTDPEMAWDYYNQTLVYPSRDGSFSNKSQDWSYSLWNGSSFLPFSWLTIESTGTSASRAVNRGQVCCDLINSTMYAACRDFLGTDDSPIRVTPTLPAPVTLLPNTVLRTENGDDGIPRASAFDHVTNRYYWVMFDNSFSPSETFFMYAPASDLNDVTDLAVYSGTQGIFSALSVDEANRELLFGISDPSVSTGYGFYGRMALEPVTVFHNVYVTGASTRHCIVADNWSGHAYFSYEYGSQLYAVRKAELPFRSSGSDVLTGLAAVSGQRVEALELGHVTGLW